MSGIRGSHFHARVGRLHSDPFHEGEAIVIEFLFDDSPVLGTPHADSPSFHVPSRRRYTHKLATVRSGRRPPVNEVIAVAKDTCEFEFEIGKRAAEPDHPFGNLPSPVHRRKPRFAMHRIGGIDPSSQLGSARVPKLEINGIARPMHRDRRTSRD
jgi:hypothetical protein